MSSIYCSRHKCKRTAHGHMCPITKHPLCAICWGAIIDGMNYAKTKMSNPGEQEENLRGCYLASVLRLKQNQDGRYLLSEGYHTKTNLGLFRTIQSIVLDGVSGSIKP